MISKDTFVAALNSIKEQEKINRDIGKSLEAVIDGYFVFGCKNKEHEALLNVLRESMDDKYEYIEWWLYETSTFTVTLGVDKKNVELNLESPEALYDFLVAGGN